VSDRYLEAVVDQFLEMIHKRLTSESGKDTYYQILSRRYGLDGEAPDTLDVISQKRNDSPEFLHQLLQEILKRCQSKTAQPISRRAFTILQLFNWENGGTPDPRTCH